MHTKTTLIAKSAQHIYHSQHLNRLGEHDRNRHATMNIAEAKTDLGTVMGCKGRMRLMMIARISVGTLYTMKLTFHLIMIITPYPFSIILSSYKSNMSKS